MKSRSPQASFTLVEILAATTILSVLMAIMFGILQQTSLGWQAANRRVEASQVARLALDQIASDLENCVVVLRANVTLPTNSTPTAYAYGFVHSNSASAPLSPTWLASGVNLSQPNDYIFVVTPYSPSLNLGTGDLCEVGYIPVFIARAGGVASIRQGQYVLLRHLPLDYGSTNAQPANDFITNSARWEQTPNGITSTNRIPFVDNCLKFRVEFFYTDNTGQTVTTSSWGRPTIQGNTVSWVGNPPGIQGLPLGADITLCVVDARTAARILKVRGGAQPLSQAELAAIPTNWSAVGQDLRTTLQSSVLTLQRRIYFKNRSP